MKRLVLKMWVILMVVAMVGRADTVLLRDDFNRANDWSLDASGVRWVPTAGNTINYQNKLFCTGAEEAVMATSINLGGGAVTISYDFVSRLTSWNGAVMRLYNADRSQYLQTTIYSNGHGWDHFSFVRYTSTGETLETYLNESVYYSHTSALPYNITLMIDATKIISYRIQAGGSPGWTNPLLTNVDHHLGGDVSAAKLAFTNTTAGGGYDELFLDNIAVTQATVPVMERVVLEDNFNRANDWNLDVSGLKWIPTTTGSPIAYQNKMLCMYAIEAFAAPAFNLPEWPVKISYDFVSRDTDWNGAVMRLYNNDKSEYLQTVIYSNGSYDYLTFSRCDGSGNVLETFLNPNVYYAHGAAFPLHVTLVVDAGKIVSYSVETGPGGSAGWVNPLLVDVPHHLGGDLSAVRMSLSDTNTPYDALYLDNVLVTRPGLPYNKVFEVPSIGPVTCNGSLSDWTSATAWSEPYILWNVPKDATLISSTTRAKFAWNDADDMLYVAVQTDEASVRAGGHVVIGLSKNIHGVPYPTSIDATQLCFDYDTTKPNNVWIRNEITTYGGSGGIDGVQAGCTVSGGIYTYEIAIPLWDNWTAPVNKLPLSVGDVVYVYACMESEWGSGNGTDLTYLGNPDFASGALDKAAALTLAAAKTPGDANSDHKVDVSDLGILAANYGTIAGATWDKGDFNGDGKVDVSDLGILAANYGTGTAGNLDFIADAKALGLSGEDTKAENPETSTLGCGSAGLPLLAGLLLAGLRAKE